MCVCFVLPPCPFWPPPTPHPRPAAWRNANGPAPSAKENRRAFCFGMAGAARCPADCCWRQMFDFIPPPPPVQISSSSESVFPSNPVGSHLFPPGADWMVGSHFGLVRGVAPGPGFFSLWAPRHFGEADPPGEKIGPRAGPERATPRLRGVAQYNIKPSVVFGFCLLPVAPHGPRKRGANPNPIPFPRNGVLSAGGPSRKGVVRLLVFGQVRS